MNDKAVPGKGAKKPRGGWLRDPQKARTGETIGGGFWVFRRGDGTGRIRPSIWPFEYASFSEAATQAESLSENHPGERFIVVGQLGAAFSPERNEEAA